MADREDLIEFLRSQLLGPEDGPSERLGSAPGQRYTLGLLFPVDTQTSLAAASPGELVDDSAIADVGQGRDDAGSAPEDPIALAAQTRPSSLGLTAFVPASAVLRAEVAAGAYTRDAPGEWRRDQLLGEVDGLCFTDMPTDILMLDGRVRLHIRWRAAGKEMALVTATMLNARTGTKSEDVLAQCGLSLEIDAPEGFHPYPSPQLDTTDPEEDELRLRYRETPTYAVGHGCAAVWPARTSTGLVKIVSSECMPIHTILPIIPGTDSSTATDIAWLADDQIATKDLAAELHAFINGYELWAEALAPPEDPRLEAAFGRIRRRIESAIRRMRSGVDLLEADSYVLDAFRLAQKAMYMQMRITRAQWDEGDRNAPLDSLERSRFRWRPFQLGYQLLTLVGVSTPSSPDRKIVDLLWFPTGGGKTEAYLALAAFTVFLRRLREGPAGEGTAVLTRYTLRLLTGQQFQRYTKLAAACELIRRAENPRLGQQPIRVGLWVGGSTGAPNKWDQAHEALEQAVNESPPRNPFQLTSCPLCDTPMVSQQDGKLVTGFSAGPSHFSSCCPDATCAFANEIPAVFIDEQIYEDPPSFVVGTVDKFARLVWEPRSGALIAPEGRNPPSLIIQDELHLLAGPLGTIAGGYEAGITLAIEKRCAAPKVIASTATIRRAQDQCRALFDSDVAVFPPSGPSADDSYFARVDKAADSSMGRKYVGVMAQSHTPTMSLVRTIAALAQGPCSLDLSGAARDAYWTVVAYHNSLRELGSTLTAARDDIPDWIREFAPSDESARPFSQDKILELTSNADESIDELLSRMNQALPSDPREDSDALDLIACTNMLSVGVDVSRLGLMVINGQPKTTAEYIQASSRVGRAEGRPGLVVAHYSASKPRDRSHYENFSAYHQALYRYVEPTSVTPFSLPAQDRTLHAALVILVRHGFGFSREEDANRVALESPEILNEAAEMILQRAKSVDPTEALHTEHKLAQIVAQWIDWAVRGKEEGHPLMYDASNTPHRSLLRRFDTGHAEGFRTLDSMRNVDATCRIDVRCR
jgi:hypothetical protein